MQEPTEFEMDDTQSWERGRGEPLRAYNAFCTYRDLGPTRNLHAAYRAWLKLKRRRGGRRIRTPQRYRCPDRAAGKLEAVARRFPLGRARRSVRLLARC